MVNFGSIHSDYVEIYACVHVFYVPNFYAFIYSEYTHKNYFPFKSLFHLLHYISLVNKVFKMRILLLNQL